MEYHPSLKLAADACSKFVADMERGAEPYWMTLSGPNGCGKTLLARQVFSESKRINPGNPVNNAIWPPDWQSKPIGGVYAGSRPYCLYYDERRIAERMRAGEYELPASMRNDFCVVIDEVGVTRDPTNFVSSSLGAVAENRMNKWTIWATNFTPTELAERMDARISSRMIRDENVFVQITAGDYALRS